MKKCYLIAALLPLFMAANISAQNVGIGTLSPTRAKIELNGMVGNTTAIFGADANGIGLVSSWPHLQYNGYFNGGHRYINNGFVVGQFLDGGNGTLGFDMSASGVKDALVTGTKNAIRFASNGRVGIGQNPGFTAQLNVARDPGMDCTAFFSAPQWSAFNYGPTEYTAIRGSANLTKLNLNYYAQNSKIVMGAEGNFLGINSAGPVYPLEIRAPDFCIGLMRLGSDNQWIMTVSQYYFKLFFRASTSNNTINQLGSFDYNTGQYSASSDSRIKKQVEPLPPTLEKLLKLKAYRYEMKYNNPNHDETIGLIAQEVKAIFPALVHVTQNANTGYKDINDVHTLSYSGLAPIVIKALQEQQAQLAALEERTARLEKTKEN
jgi:hypothetical protein